MSGQSRPHVAALVLAGALVVSSLASMVTLVGASAARQSHTAADVQLLRDVVDAEPVENGPVFQAVQKNLRAMWRPEFTSAEKAHIVASTATAGFGMLLALSSFARLRRRRAQPSSTN